MVWPFEKKFTEVPCARESAMSGILGGVLVGAYWFTKRPQRSFPVAVNSGFVIFWVTYVGCRILHWRQQTNMERFKKMSETGELDSIELPSELDTIGVDTTSD